MVNAGAYLVAVINLNYESTKDQYGLAAALAWDQQHCDHYIWR